MEILVAESMIVSYQMVPLTKVCAGLMVTDQLCMCSVGASLCVLKLQPVGAKMYGLVLNCKCCIYVAVNDCCAKKLGDFRTVRR